MIFLGKRSFMRGEVDCGHTGTLEQLLEQLLDKKIVSPVTLHRSRRQERKAPWTPGNLTEEVKLDNDTVQKNLIHLEGRFSHVSFKSVQILFTTVIDLVGLD